MAEPLKRETTPPAAAPRPRPSEILKERWTQWVALTTTVLAVCAAISSLRGGAYSTRVQLATTREANRWSYFQSKSIKQHVVETERDLLRIQALDARAPEAKEAIASRLAVLDGEIARFDKEKGDIKADAERIQKDEEAAKRVGASFGLAVMLLQIAIMLSSVAALMKKPAMWVAGLVLGAAGLAYMANGFFGWF
jgi:hypothetical protein